MNKKKPVKETITCITCEKSKEKENNYYNSKGTYSVKGKAPICKKCIATRVDITNMDTVYKMLSDLDIKFDPDYWKKAEESERETFGRYMSMVNSLSQFEGTGWKDSILDTKTEHVDTNKTISSVEVSDELKEKWGEYPAEEIALFEKKYQQLRVNYPERTAMHVEALQIYVRYRVKEELATQKNEYKEAEAWGKLAKEAATAAKINPSQLSKADLSDGLDSFSTLVRSVEKAVDIIPILPQFKEKPKDKVDFTLLCYVNYIRDLKGLPPATYQDIYQFYEERKEMYKDFDFLNDESDLS